MAPIVTSLASIVKQFGIGGFWCCHPSLPNVYTISNPGGGLTLSTALDGSLK
jgi:hypothetical protein